MPQAVDIILQDAQATPVSHTFVPIGRDLKDPQTFWFEDQSQATPIGYWRVSVKTVRPAMTSTPGASASRAFRVTVGLHMPVLETLSNDNASGIRPAPTLSYVPRSFTEYVMAERSVLQDRKDLRTMTAQLQANPQITDFVENLLIPN